MTGLTPASVVQLRWTHRTQKGASRPKKLRSDRACESTVVIGGSAKEQTTKQPLSVRLSVCLSVCRKNYATLLYSNRISCSKSSFRISFLFRRASLGIFLSAILHCFQSKNPTLFAKKGGEMQNFFKFFCVFSDYNSFFYNFFLFSWGFGYFALHTMQSFLKKHRAYSLTSR